ncbi:hypothetical protein [Tuwongella immobilis]|uniref:Uncharacterized protein n=1 Tax=Tuwongella immobilis TaxID=692036 RepID=A0A6C2YKN8_9BACT|nr:hypothetical protein [Tuwongella immobilis]VIP01871.1 unnamed protein product [Tuwongella immobilis]VTR99701.1 unnamed protein product [Tuwongella immobilis]
MIRNLLTISGLALICAVVGAQSPPQLSVLDQNRLLQRNRELLRELVGRSLELAKSTDPLAKLGSCQPIVAKLTDEIRIASEANDLPRVIELGKHLDKLLLDGVTPNVQRARGRITRGSQDERKFIEVRDQILQSVAPIESAIPANSRSGQGRELSELRQLLQDAQNQIRKASGF